MTATLHEKCEAGDALMTLSIYAGTRDEVAQHTRALRRWISDILPSAEALGLTAGRRVYPKDHETTSVHRVILRPLVVVRRNGVMAEAQRKTLVMTAALLYRLRPHLGPARGRGGRPRIDPPERIEAIAAEMRDQKRQRRNPIKDRAIKKVLDMIDIGEDPQEDTYDKAFERLKKIDFI